MSPGGLGLLILPPPAHTPRPGSPRGAAEHEVFTHSFSSAPVYTETPDIHKLPLNENILNIEKYTRTKTHPQSFIRWYYYLHGVVSSGLFI